MAFDETFPADEPLVAELAQAAPATAADSIPEPLADAVPTDAQPDQAAYADAGIDTGADAGADADNATPDADTDTMPATVAAPAFNEADFFKTHFGDDAPETAAELKTRFDTLKANQLTDAQRGQLALLDPANKEKFAEFAALAGKDYDTMLFGDAMRERFVLEHPGMDADLVEYEFGRQFAQKYPTLAAALANPSAYDETDQELIIEKKAADYAARADRTALKAAQENTTQRFYAEALAAQASTAPQSSPEQIADAQSVLKWSDETFKDGATLPIDLGNGEVVQMPIGDPKSFKDGFIDPDKLYRNHVLGKDGKINREMQAEIALFLKDPKGYRTFIANAVKGAAAPALPIAELTNSSAAKAARAQAAAASAAATNHPQHVAADAWQNSNA